MEKVSVYTEEIKTYDREGTPIAITVIGVNKSALSDLTLLIIEEGRKRKLLTGGSSGRLTVKELAVGETA
jgi:hypothetical protein